jgi:predicted phosphodiesterase
LIRVLHFSDPHVQLPRWRERKLKELGPLRALATVELWKGRGADYDHALDKLKQIVRDADALKADFVVCTGDFTQLAMEEEFALAREVLEPVMPRFIGIHGNHDRYPLNGAPNKLYETYFPPRSLPDPFVALDSCGDLCWPVLTQGHVNPAELQRDFAKKIVLIHHAPVRDWPWHELRGRKALLEKTREATAVLCGHKHERQSFGNVWCAGSSTERGKEGYFVLQVDGGRVVASAVARPGTR